MQQKTINQTDNALQNIPFWKKSTGLSLIITGGTAAYFFANAWMLRPVETADQMMPPGYVRLAFFTALIIIMTQTLLQAVLAIGAGSVEVATSETDRVAPLKAKRNAYGVLMVAVIATVGAVFLFDVTLYDTLNLLLFSLVLAEMIKIISQLIYTSR